MASKLSQLLVIFFLFSFFSAYVNSALFTYRMYIYNATPKSVDIHCSARGQDLGDHPLNPKDFYKLELPIVDKGDNHIYCDITFGDKKGNFELFNYDRDVKLCESNTSTCYWDVQEDGLCLISGDHCVFHLNWN